jgi:hypothetical protein
MESSWGIAQAFGFEFETGGVSGVLMDIDLDTVYIYHGRQWGLGLFSVSGVGQLAVLF